MENLSINEFLERNLISQEDWEHSGLDWQLLKAIGSDHLARTPQLEETAEYFAKTLLRFNKVHSVRWRVKDAEHLVAKIVRKRVQQSAKYLDISIDNYNDIVTDLIGVRALHLFKTDCFEIDQKLRCELDLAEAPIAYVRNGDDLELRHEYEKAGIQVKDHPYGYRSVHYVVTAMPTKRKVNAEIQVRTIFEEGWSEIDHTVRYPNFSNNPQVAHLLTIFNRLAGSADEIGGFVRILKIVLSDAQAVADTARRAADAAVAERDASVAKMEDALEQLAKLQTGHAEQEQITAVKVELEKLKIDDKKARVLDEKVANWIDQVGSGYANLPQWSLEEAKAIGAIVGQIKSAGMAPSVTDHLKGLDEAKAVGSIVEQMKATTHAVDLFKAREQLNGLDEARAVGSIVEQMKATTHAADLFKAREQLKGLDEARAVGSIVEQMKRIDVITAGQDVIAKHLKGL
jgi:ppGpp synthetase/RelA/SpoT-type nucleotidyltranferase